MKLFDLLESGSITETYRRLKAEFDALVKDHKGQLPELEKESSGNVWTNIDVLKKNIATLKRS